MSSIKKICLCAICTALCYVLPLAFHPLVMGTALSPMHIPVLLCGLLCGWPYGAFCGVVGPLLSSLLSGMPPAAMLLYMIPELCVYIVPYRDVDGKDISKGQKRCRNSETM